MTSEKPLSSGESFSPKAPVSIEELDIPLSLVEDIILRYLYTRSYCTVSSLSEAIKLPFPLVKTIFLQLRQRQIFEVRNMEEGDYSFTLSGKGRDLAAERFDICRYSGPAPVSMNDYFQAVRKQAARLNFNQDFLREAFSDLVMTEAVLDQLGPALISQKSIFLYGPTGNGKTSIAIRMRRIFEDTILVPYAVEFDGQVIVLYDPSSHKAVPREPRDKDPRWIRCKRPSIFVGGELEQKMLELEMEESSKVYVAPLQMKANNGILVIDDFGRQIVSPHYLLNRWIVPLDRRIDYLTMRYGLKFAVPFEMIVVFSTNLDPNQLADEAFLRRIQNKIYIESLNADVFDRIFQNMVDTARIRVERGCAELLRTLCLSCSGGKLRACYPTDIIDIIRSISRYEGRDPEVTGTLIRRAVNQYFTRPETPETPGK